MFSSLKSGSSSSFTSKMNCWRPARHCHLHEHCRCFKRSICLLSDHLLHVRQERNRDLSFNASEPLFSHDAPSQLQLVENAPHAAFASSLCWTAIGNGAQGGGTGKIDLVHQLPCFSLNVQGPYRLDRHTILADTLRVCVTPGSLLCYANARVPRIMRPMKVGNWLSHAFDPSSKIPCQHSPCERRLTRM